MEMWLIYGRDTMCLWFKNAVRVISEWWNKLYYILNNSAEMQAVEKKNENETTFRCPEMVSELTPASPSSHPGNVPGYPTFSKLSLPLAAPAAGGGGCGDTAHNYTQT